MRRDLRRTALGLASVGLLLAVAPAFAQRSSSFGSSGGFSSTSIGGGASSGSSGGSAFGGSMGGNSGFGGNSAFGGTSGGNSAFGGTSGGNSAFGGTSGTTTGRGGGTTQVGSTSFLGTTYANPLAMGLSSGSGTTSTSTSFGNALYNLTTSRSGTATVSTSTSGQNGQFGAGYNIRRLPGYATTLKIKDLPPPPGAEQVRTDLQTMLTQSSQLDSRDSVRVVIDGQAVVLQGQVADDDERRLVENMVRLTPGVYQVHNDLKTTTTTTAARGP